MFKKAGKAMIRAVRKAGLLSAYGSARSRLVRQQVAILAYHRIDRLDSHPWSLPAITPEDFESEIRFLSRKYRIISLNELIAALDDFRKLPANAAVVTIDDGYKDNYIHAYPILKKFGIPATIFLVTGHVSTGNLFWLDKVRYAIWNTDLPTLELDGLGTYHLGPRESRQQIAEAINENLKKLPVDTRDNYLQVIMRSTNVEIPADLGKDLLLSWDEVREMSRNGIDFSAHTVSHPNLSKLPLADAEREILDSRRKIEKELGKEITTFCYPNGEPDDFNLEIEEILERNGFKCALTLAPLGFVSPKSQRYQLPRIPGAIDPAMFELLMSGLYTDLVKGTSGYGK